MHDAEARLLFLGLLYPQNILASQLVVAHVLFLVVKLAIAVRRCPFKEMRFKEVVVFVEVLFSFFILELLLFQLKVLAIVLKVMVLQGNHSLLVDVHRIFYLGACVGQPVFIMFFVLG
jgi:hypothetical protein